MRSRLLVCLFLACLTTDAARSINKCCGRKQHLDYHQNSNLYVCEDELQPSTQLQQLSSTMMAPLVERAEGVGAEIEDTTRADSADGAQDKLSLFLEAVRNVTVGAAPLRASEVAQASMPKCAANKHLAEYLFFSGSMVQFAVRAQHDGVQLVARGRTFVEADWCADVDKDGDLIAVVCPCAAGRCVRTCCLPNAGINETTLQCVDDVPPWQPRTRTPNMTDFYLFHDKEPECKESLMAIVIPAGELDLLDNLTLRHTMVNGQVRLHPSNTYCAAATPTAAREVVKFCPERVREVRLTSVDDATGGTRYEPLVRACALLASAAALVVTVAVTAAFPALRRNINDKMALCHNVALLAAVVAVSSGQLASSHMLFYACKPLGFLMQFGILAAFFWLNAICIEVARVFSKLRPMTQPGDDAATRKFFWYSVYAWGATGCVSLVTIACELAPAPTLRPHFGDPDCFFRNQDIKQPIIFLYGPMACLLFVNFVLFAYTAIKIFSHRQETSVLMNTDSQTINSRNKQNLIVYTKLFMLMGVTWIFEIVSWAVGGNSYYWLLIDCINLLRGVIIFVIFCCERHVLNMVRTRLGFLPLPTAQQQQQQQQRSACALSTVEDARKATAVSSSSLQC